MGSYGTGPTSTYVSGVEWGPERSKIRLTPDPDPSIIPDPTSK